MHCREAASRDKTSLRYFHRATIAISTEGSFSVRVSDDSFLRTLSQRDRETLEIADFVLAHDRQSEGGKTPRRASLAHQAIYRQHPTINAIVFAHPVNATAFSITSAVFESRTIPESDIVLRDVHRVPYGVQYEPGDCSADFVSATSPAAIASHVQNHLLVIIIFESFCKSSTEKFPVGYTRIQT